MQKSGSGYLYNVINELLIISGSGVDARKIKQNRNIDRLMKWHNNNVGEFGFYKILKLLQISFQDGTFVIKSHSGPNLLIKVLSKFGLIRIIYSYRDPRDVLLSAIDHGNKILPDGEVNAFKGIVEFDKALLAVKDWVSICEQYAKMPNVLMVKYEKMMQNPIQTIIDIENFLKISLPADKRQEISWKFSKENPEGIREGLHFNKAQSLRYQIEMTDEQKSICKTEFKNYLEKMGFETS